MTIRLLRKSPTTHVIRPISQSTSSVVIKSRIPNHQTPALPLIVGEKAIPPAPYLPGLDPVSRAGARRVKVHAQRSLYAFEADNVAGHVLSRPIAGPYVLGQESDGVDVELARLVLVRGALGRVRRGVEGRLAREGPRAQRRVDEVRPPRRRVAGRQEEREEFLWRFDVR